MMPSLTSFKLHKRCLIVDMDAKVTDGYVVFHLDCTWHILSDTRTDAV